MEEYKLSSFNRELINAKINNLSERSKLYMELYNALFELSLARMDVINYGLDNVGESNNSEILDELEQDISLSGKYSQLDWLLQCGNISDAETLLSNIASLEGDEISLRYKMAEINLSLLNENNLTYNQYSVLNEIVDTKPISSIPAQSLLKYYGGKKFERVPFIAIETQARKARPEMVIANEKKEIKIFPNPTSEKFTVAFSNNSSGELQIRSMSGSFIKSYNVFSSKEINIKASNLSKGMYLIVFIPNDQSQKLYPKLIIQ